MLINEISIILPALNEEKSIPILLNEIYKNLNKTDISYEIILVDDGSENHLEDYIEKNEKLKIFRNHYTKGQTQSILYGIEESNFEYLFILDSDGQNPPSEIMKIVNYYNENFDSCDVVSGIRVNRKDKKVRSLYSKFANWMIRLLTKSKCKDLGCAMKLFRKDMLSGIEFNGDIHRIIVPIFEYRNYKLLQINVKHNPREFGETNYGFGRVIAVTIDSILLYLTEGFTKSVRYALGKLSLYFGILSTLFFSLAIYQKYTAEIFVHKNPIFLIGIVTFFVSLQFFATSITSFFIENKYKN